MVGWLPLAISKDRGCNSRLHQDGWEMTGRLASSSSQVFGCNCRSPRDGCEMAGWLARAISKGCMCHFGSLGDGWEMAGRAPVVSEQPTKSNTISTAKNRQCNSKAEPVGWVLGAGYFTNISDVNLNHQEMAGRWLGDGWVVAPRYF